MIRVRAAQQKVADEKFNVFPVDCTGLKQQDGWHFRASAQAWLGEQFVSAVLRGEGKRQVSFRRIKRFRNGTGRQGRTGASVRVSFRPTGAISSCAYLCARGRAKRGRSALENGGYTFTMPTRTSFSPRRRKSCPSIGLPPIRKRYRHGFRLSSAEAKNGWYEGESATLAVSPGPALRSKERRSTASPQRTRRRKRACIIIACRRARTWNFTWNLKPSFLRKALEARRKQKENPRREAVAALPRRRGFCPWLL